MASPGVFDGLAPAWKLAFEQAWVSFQADNFGIGAVLTDPGCGDLVVAVGRNRVAQRHAELRTLSGNMTAHAEMNAFASLDRFNAEGLELYTTLEPCLMCIGTAMQLKVAHVHFAATDEFYVGMDGLWANHPVTAARYPAITGPLPEPLAAFGRLLPLVFTLRHFPGRMAEQQARARHPELSAIADGLDSDIAFAEIKRSGSIDDALAHLFPDRPA